MHKAAEWLELYAPGYHRLRPGERSALSDFVLLWSLFEGQVLERNATIPLMFATMDDWDAVGALPENDIADVWAYFVNRYAAGGAVTGRFNALRISRREYQEFLENAMCSEVPDTLTIHKALALIIYRLRNNLLHGEKWLYELRDQEENFRYASHVLMIWMDANKAR